MNEPLALNVTGIDTAASPDSARITLYCEQSEAVILNLTPRKLMQMSVIIDQLALDFETARYLAKAAPLPPENHSEAREFPVVAPVHIACALTALRTPDRGLLLDVKSLRGEHFRLSFSAEQAHTVLASLLPAASRQTQ